jgi:hypothetical protein
MHHEHYLPVVLSALTVLLLGCINFPGLQAKADGKKTGQPNYLWLALISFLVGALAVWFFNRKEY